MEADAAGEGREAEIERAFRARLPDFRKQADSLTLEGVRRALEKDMGLEKHSLDAHKKLIKQCVDKVFSGSDDDNGDNNAPVKAEAKDDHSSKEESEDAQPTPDLNKISSNSDELVAKSSETERDQEGDKDHGSGSDISEAMIKNAIVKRASYFRENSETLTLLGVRRTLEEDLKLQKKALDAYKSFITTELDNILQEPANGTKKNSKTESRKDSGKKTIKNSKRARQDSDTSEINDSHCERGDSDEDTRPKKTKAEKGKAVKRQKKGTVDKQLSSPKSKKIAKKDSNKTKEQGGSTEEDSSHSSAEEDNKKKQLVPAYGKRVERLKSIIKSCGMSIAPSVYRRVKMAPENKREACLIKELEDILEKEGLSTNPSEKEIKAVKKRKERAKELEGIDMSNIITSSRRRSTSSFIPLPTPKIVADSDDDDEEDDDDDEEANVEGGDGDNDDGEAGNGSADDAEHDSD
ncbi:HIRA-interacting protein 3 isoform X1 [Oryza brachyantha]|uniref:HIRA-interacting protein 3 isoform X1 n=1 Tax=Oryza brachyantha TaxID=4533 RepID=UPI0007764A6B|nr:HIRA-interacting protein 3 isoform X1 [Oryza brachyantha]